MPTTTRRPRVRRAPALAAAILLPALLLATAGCGDSGTEPRADPTVSGSWTGTSQGVTVNLVLNEGTGGAVAGSGNISGGELNLALIVRQGTHAYPNLTLVLGAQGYEDMNFTGTLLSETQIAGTLNGSGFDGFNLNLARQ